MNDKQKFNWSYISKNPYLRNWFKFLVWCVILTLLFQTIGVCFIHESGHYIVGRLSGCPDLKITCAGLTWKDSLNNVTGWETCKSPVVMAKDGSRVCNFPTNLNQFAGLFFSLIFFIPLIILINYYFKKRLNKYYLNKKLIILILIFTVFMALQSSAYDLFKVTECLFNTNLADKILRLALSLSNIFPFVVLLFFLPDFISILRKIKDNIKNKGKNKK